MANIVVVDDDKEVCKLIKTALERDGHFVTALQSGREVDETHCRWAEIILLDVMMPVESGFETCKRIRSQTACPILFLTAKSEESDILTGLGIGGDDYLLKPFRISELRARVNAHIRREHRPAGSFLRRGDLELDLEAKCIYCKGILIKLTKSEYAICEYLAMHNGQTFTKEQIYENVFGYDRGSEETAITEHIKNIRAKLRVFEKEPIQTIWGVGYQWKVNC